MRGVERAKSAPDEAAGARGRWLTDPSSLARLSPAELPALLSRGQWMHTHLPAHLCCTPVGTHTPPMCPGHGRTRQPRAVLGAPGAAGGLKDRPGIP